MLILTGLADDKDSEMRIKQLVAGSALAGALGRNGTCGPATTTTAAGGSGTSATTAAVGSGCSAATAAVATGSTAAAVATGSTVTADCS
jgi:hypothetical protein